MTTQAPFQVDCLVTIATTESPTTAQKGPNMMNAHAAYDANPWGSLLGTGMEAKHKVASTSAKAKPARAASSSKCFDNQDAGG